MIKIRLTSRYNEFISEAYIPESLILPKIILIDNAVYEKVISMHYYVPTYRAVEFQYATYHPKEIANA